MKNILEKFKDQKVLILGFGREGLSTYKFIRKYYPKKRIYVADKDTIKLPEDNYLTANLGDNYLDNLSEFDLIVKTPGISYEVQQINDCVKRGVEVTTQTQLFLECFKDKTIGITGTKGKSTTTSLIYHILKKAGIKAQIVGNIGKPVLDYIDEKNADGLYVFEMSSHQLSDVKESPRVAVFLNIFPEHLDYYASFGKYLEAKRNIIKYQNASDIIIFNNDQNEIKEVCKTSLSKKFSFSSKDKVLNGCYLEVDNIVYIENRVQKYVFDTKKIKLRGRHNLNNVMATIIAANVFGVNFKDIASAIETFNPLEDRLEVVGVVNGVTFINDTLATIPQATIAALESLGDKTITLILGGFDRGVDFDILGKDISQRKNVLNVITVGQTGPLIIKSLNRAGYRGSIINLKQKSMKEIVENAFRNTSKDGVVLLSPASTSFDMFKDYKDRGDQFKDAVLKIK